MDGGRRATPAHRILASSGNKGRSGGWATGAADGDLGAHMPSGSPSAVRGGLAVVCRQQPRAFLRHPRREAGGWCRPGRVPPETESRRPLRRPRSARAWCPRSSRSGSAGVGRPTRWRLAQPPPWVAIGRRSDHRLGGRTRGERDRKWVERLIVAQKRVDHHVSATLRRLGAPAGVKQPARRFG
jgi:hypothetical protein